MGDLKSLLRHFIHEFWRRRWSILAVAWIVGLLGAYMAASAPDVYTSRATVFVDSKNLLTRILGRQVLINDPAEEIDNVRRLMYARPNLLEVIHRTNLDLYVDDERQLEGLIENMEKKLSLTRQGRDFYKIEYEHKDPEKAHDVVAAMLSLFLEEGLERGSGVNGAQADQGLRLLRTDYNRARTRLDEVQAKLRDYEREHRDSVATPTAVSSEKRSLEGELSQLRSEKTLYEQELARLGAQLAGTERQIIVRYRTPPAPLRPNIPRPTTQKVPVPQGPTLEEQRYQGLQQRANAMQAEMDQMLNRLTPQHPDVLAMQRRVQAAQAEADQAGAQAQAAGAELQRRIQEAYNFNARVDQELAQWEATMNAPVATPEPEPIYGPNPVVTQLQTQAGQTRSRLVVTEQKIDNIRARLNDLQAILVTQPEILQEYEKLRSEENSLSGEVSRLEDEIGRLEKTIDFGDEQFVEFRIVEPPKVPVKPTGPNRLIMFMGAAIMALGAGAGLAFLRIQLSDNMPTVAHLREAFDLPILGSVSAVRSQGQAAQTVLSNVAFMVGLAAFAMLFAFLIYRYHIQLWRPDLGAALSGAKSAVGGLI